MNDDLRERFLACGMRVGLVIATKRFPRLPSAEIARGFSEEPDPNVMSHLGHVERLVYANLARDRLSLRATDAIAAPIEIDLTSEPHERVADLDGLAILVRWDAASIEVVVADPEPEPVALVLDDGGRFVLGAGALAQIESFVATSSDDEARERAQARLRSGGDFERVLAAVSLARTERREAAGLVKAVIAGTGDALLTALLERQAGPRRFGEQLGAEALQALSRHAVVMIDEIARLVEEGLADSPARAGLIATAVRLRAEIEGLRFVLVRAPDARANLVEALERLDEGLGPALARAGWPAIELLVDRTIPTDAADLDAWWLRLIERARGYET